MNKKELVIKTASSVSLMPPDNGYTYIRHIAPDNRPYSLAMSSPSPLSKDAMNRLTFIVNIHKELTQIRNVADGLQDQR
jgi:hypothetical protein